MHDSYGRKIEYLRLSVTDLCNLRCRYCMPEEGVCKKSHDDMLTEDELIRAVEAAAALGIKKLRITGGEPLVKRNILSICRRAAAVDGIETLCLTTNGTLLEKFSKDLRQAGVTRLNISLDTLNREKFAALTRTGRLSDALAGLETALMSGFDKIKVNTVLMAGFNDDEIEALAALTCQYPIDLRFIELMPMTTGFGQGSYLPAQAVLERLPQLEPVGRDGVAAMYRLPDGKGRVGLITPVSDHFCGTCDRLRLTADGKVKPCLHGREEFSLKGLDYDGMKAVFARAIGAKPLWHGTLDADHPSNAGRSMHQIGG